MSKTIKWIAVFVILEIWFTCFGFAQTQNAKLDSILQVLLAKTPEEAYDPLIPQAFVFDKKHNTFGAINSIENSIDIIRLEEDTLHKVKKVPVDKFEGRHDMHHIYRPQGIAIYEGYIVFLASHRDSCYLSILNLQGDEINRFYYKGNATAFSYSKEAQQMYIAGQNSLGYDLIVLSTKDGIAKMSEDAPALHYQKPKKDEIIKEADPVGIGMAAIAMTVVFLALLLLTTVFVGSGKILMAFQRKKAIATSSRSVMQESTSNAKYPALTSGEEYAAIAAAIYMYTNELHDEENAILTIEKTTRAWTPWNAKYFNMNTYFMRKR